PTVQVVQGGSAEQPIQYQTHGPCAWRITPSVEANSLGISGSFLYSAYPLQPGSSSLILGSLAAASTTPPGTYPIRLRFGGVAIDQGQTFTASPVELPVTVSVVPAPQPAGGDDCQVSFQPPAAVSIAPGGSAMVTIPYQTHGLCQWRVSPSV